MKKLLLAVGLGLLLTLGHSQTAKKVPVSTEIEEVLLYLQGAQISRTGSINIPAGKSLLTFSNLSPSMDPKSIQVKLTGAVTLLTVNHLIDFLPEEDENAPIKAFDNAIKEIIDSIAEKRAMLDVLNEEIIFLNSNRATSSTTQGIELDEMKAIYTFYSDRLRTIKMEELKIKANIKALEEDKTNLEKQRKELFKNPDSRKSQIEVLVETDTKQMAEIELAYFCTGAGWFPTYDMHATEVNEPIDLTYKARVYQRTGEEWEQIKLILSNADPNLSSTLPELSPLYLSYKSRNSYQFQSSSNTATNGPRTLEGIITDENGEALIGANVLVKGMSTGTVSDIDGKFSFIVPSGVESVVISYTGFKTQEIPLNAGVGPVQIKMQEDATLLQEVVVVGYGLQGRTAGVQIEDTPSFREEERPLPVQKIENPTTINFEIDLPFTIPSTGEEFLVELTKYKIPATYEYQCIPKVENPPFLTAKVNDWDQYDLLIGEANLFFEETYLGRSLIDVRFVDDSLNLSLGRDKGVLVNRSKIRDYYKETFINNKKIETRAFEILVQNNKTQQIRILVKDQIPVSRTKNIEVQKIDVGSGFLNEDTGEIQWSLVLQPGEQRKLPFKYTVKFDRNRNIAVE